MTLPSVDELHNAYDLQVRRNTAPDGSGATADAAPTFVRWAANNGLGWSEISWSALNEENASDAITRHIDFFRDRGQSFVWRVQDNDQPSDLGARLLEAGFSFSATSAVMVAAAASLSVPAALPEGTELVHVTDQQGVDLLIETHEKVFGHSHQELRRSILARLENAPLESEMFVVTAEGAPISSARIEFLPQRDFATLWGGGTVPDWRGRGIYKALVAQRAHVAVARGYKYLTVLASDQSRPILSRLGFVVISNVSTYTWAPSATVRE
ncbi:MAG TPA: GNAT family N-acetyltransferase [Acidimicrobiales bacterium]